MIDFLCTAPQARVEILQLFLQLFLTPQGLSDFRSEVTVLLLEVQVLVEKNLLHILVVLIDCSIFHLQPFSTCLAR